MTLLKNSFLLLFACSILFLCACKKDCSAPIIEENIVGIWEESSSGEQVEFKADGTFIDENDIFISLNTPSSKSYEIVGSIIKFSASAIGGSNTGSGELTVIGNKCDEIKLSVIGQVSTLSRQ